MYLLILLVSLVCVLWIILTSKQKTEPFQAAWADYVIYTDLSRRLRVGMTKDWLNLNGFAWAEQFFQYCNVEIVIYNSVHMLLESLLINKHIDVAFVTELDYSMYISKKLNRISLDHEFVKKNKGQIAKNFTSRRLYTLNPMYRVFLASNIQISKPNDVIGKTIQITNITNNIYRLDLDILNTIKYNKFYEDEQNANKLYGTINNIGLRMDGYFTDIDNPNEIMKEASYSKNITMIDLYDESSTDKNNFESPNKLLERHIALTKDKMDLSSYPEIVQRRKQIIELYNLPYDPKKVNCYRSKIIGITREDVEAEWIYLFTKSINDNLSTMLKNMNLPLFSKKEMYSSVLDIILPIHPAVYKE